MKTIRFHLALFITLLLISGITAFPLQTEIKFLVEHHAVFPSFLRAWIIQVNHSIQSTPDVMFYGTDWLAFGHIVIALFFLPVLLQPLHYRANLYVGLSACLLVFPLAFIFGPIRGIPFFHQLIDCAFGLFGFLYLLYILRKINGLDPITQLKTRYETPGLH